MKKKVLSIIILALIIFLPKAVFAAPIDDLIAKGSYTFKSIPPANEDESWVVFELFYDEFEDYYLEDCNETFTLCNVTKYGDVVIENLELKYEYDKDFKAEFDKTFRDMPKDIYFSDMEYFSYLIYGFKKNTYAEGTDEWDAVEEKNISVRYNYSTELRKYLNYKNFEITPGMGYDEVLSSYVSGYGLLKYNGVAYKVFTGVSVYSPHVIYLDNDTTDVAKAIKDRLTVVFGDAAKDITVEKTNSVYYEVTDEDYANVPEYLDAVTEYWTNDYNNDIDYLKDYYPTAADFIKEVAPETLFLPDAEDDFYNININGVDWIFVVILDSSKVNNSVSLITSDVNTDITISTNDASVPLDAIIQAKTVENADLKDKVGTENYYVFDIGLYSDAISDYVKELSDGTFKVSIPIPKELEGKTMMVYYITSEGKLEEHKVTVNNGYAEFTTNHFSEYVLAEVPTEASEANPATLDDIFTYVAIMGLSAVGVIAIARVLKRKSSK